MGRVSYVCVTCGEHFTRKTSSKRHNLNIHKGSGETVSYLQYLAGTNSGRYRVLHPSWHHGRKRFGMDIGIGPYAICIGEGSGTTTTDAITADSMGFRRAARLQQQQQRQQSSSTMSSPEVEEDYPDESLTTSSYPSQQASPPQTPPMDDNGTTTTTTTTANAWATLSSETIAKIAELRRLAYQYGL